MIIDLYNIIDIEANGLLEQATKVHCLCVSVIGFGYNTNEMQVMDRRVFTEAEEMRVWLSDSSRTLVGHNIIRYDIPLLEKLLGITIKARLIDTLSLSWYLFPSRTIHGLEEWGKDFAIDKPKVLDWEGITIEEQQILDYYETLNR
jgi:DNA polymerase III alpha subunit (gram-positive type)